MPCECKSRLISLLTENFKAVCVTQTSDDADVIYVDIALITVKNNKNVTYFWKGG